MEIENLTSLLGIYALGTGLIVFLNFYFNLAEIILTAPFSVIMFVFIYRELTKHTSIGFLPEHITRFTPWILIISLALFFEGVGIHAAANHISYYITDSASQAGVYAFIYDEIIGHWIMYAALFGLMIGAIMIQIQRPFTLTIDKIDRLIMIASAVGYGFGLSLAFIEGQSAIPGLAASILFIPFLILHHTARDHKLHVIIKKYPMNFWLAVVFLTVIATSLVYFAVFGGFPPLSTWLHWRYV